MTDLDPAGSESQTSNEAEHVSRLRGYDKRVEEWLASLKGEAEQRSPEVLSALATKAKDVADYLEKMADKARSNRGTDEQGQSAPPNERTGGSDPS
jgi:hypothetical protein